MSTQTYYPRFALFAVLTVIYSIPFVSIGVYALLDNEYLYSALLFSIPSLIGIFMFYQRSKQRIVFDRDSLTMVDITSKQRVTIAFADIRECGFKGSDHYPLLTVLTRNGTEFVEKAINFSYRDIADIDKRLSQLPTYALKNHPSSPPALF